MEIELHFHRPGKASRIFREGFIEDDGMRLRTLSIVPPEFAQSWSRSYQREGFIAEGSLIHSVRKYHFYQEYFGIMELFDPNQAVLGWYVDIATPLEHRGGIYHRTDLFLDLWLGADGQVRELDLEEFAGAVRAGVISKELEEAARRTLIRVEREIEQHVFPASYVYAR